MANDTAHHTSSRRVVIAANPFSGADANRERVSQLEAALVACDLEPTVLWRPDELQKAVDSPDFAATTRCVVAAGGDGTVHRVMNHRPQTAIAVYALGTENLLARHFGYSADADKLAAAIARNQTQPVDLGRCGDTLFSIVLSAGFDGHVAHSLANWRAKRGKKLKRVRRSSYLYPIARAALSYRYPMMTLHADGQKITGALVMIFNLPQYGFDFKIAPDANPSDGLLDYVVFQKPGRLNLARYALALQRQKHLELDDVIHGRAAKLRLESQVRDILVPMEMDGEAWGHTTSTPTNIAIEPASSQLIVMG